jgi:hypothetical protein
MPKVAGLQGFHKVIEAGLDEGLVASQRDERGVVGATGPTAGEHQEFQHANVHRLAAFTSGEHGGLGWQHACEVFVWEGGEPGLEQADGVVVLAGEDEVLRQCDVGFGALEAVVGVGHGPVPDGLVVRERPLGGFGGVGGVEGRSEDGACEWEGWFPAGHPVGEPEPTGGVGAEGFDDLLRESIVLL